MRRSAVALNNMAVAMLDKHCYMQAYKILNDAVTLLEVSRGEATDTRVDEFMLRRATQFMSQPDVSSVKLSITSIGDDFVIAGNGPVTSLQTQSSDCFYSVRIEADTLEDFEKDPSEQTASNDTLATVVRYNFGLSLLCLAKTKAKVSSTFSRHRRPQAEGHDVTAMYSKVIRLAYEVLSSCDENSLLTEPKFYLVVFLQLQALLRILAQYGQEADVISCANMLSQLLSCERDFDLVPVPTNITGSASNCLSIYRQTLASAAAAA